MRPARLRSVLAASAVCVLGAIGAVTAVPSASAAAGCSVTYRVGSQWPGGFSGSVDLTNLGDPLNGWTLTWSFTAGQQVSQGWNAVFSQSGAQVTARNQTWNAGLGTGAVVNVGFNGSWNNSANPAPTTFALNGVACTGSTTPTTGTPPTTAAPPTTTVPTTAPPTTAPPRTTFTNPIKQRGPDPWLTYYEGYYYLATTTWNNTITMRRSRTLGGLASAADTLLFTLTRPNGAGTMWAPEFHLLDGPSGRRWYFYYTAGQEPFNLGTQRIHVLESTGPDPMGPYTFKADLLDPTQNNTWELDPGILQLNGQLYLLGTFYNGSQPMFIRPMSNPWTASGTRRILTTPTLPWETVGGAVAEGGEVLQRNGRTFIVYSASHCSTPDYKLGMLEYISGDPLNSSSWRKSPNPVFQRNNTAGVYGPGHNGFFKSPDGTEDWIVYHANASTNAGCDINRTTRAQKFTWNPDGTPNLGTPIGLGVPIAVPAGEPAS